MKQKNKTYEQPEMEVVQLETQPLLAGSQSIQMGGEGGRVVGMYREDIYGY